MAEFDEALFDERLFGGGILRSATGLAVGQGIAAGAGRASYVPHASAQGAAALQPRSIRGRPALAVLRAAGWIFCATAFGVAAVAARAKGLFSSSNLASGIVVIVGSTGASYVTGAGVAGASTAQGTGTQFTLPPPATGARVVAWLRPTI